jgi:hypothetical protein
MIGFHSWPSPKLPGGHAAAALFIRAAFIFCAQAATLASQLGAPLTFSPAKLRFESLPGDAIKFHQAFLLMQINDRGIFT